MAQLMLQKGNELRDDAEARRHELLATDRAFDPGARRPDAGARHDMVDARTRLNTQLDMVDARTRLNTQLDKLALHLADGWGTVNEEVRARFGRWLDRQDRRG